MNFEIYQLELRDYKRASINLYLHNERPDGPYQKVYEGVIDSDRPSTMLDVLQPLYRKFNDDQPSDFDGRSLSATDIVKVQDNYYMCMICGWEKVMNPASYRLSASLLH